jgi:hypothetical protein
MYSLNEYVDPIYLLMKVGKLGWWVAYDLLQPTFLNIDLNLFGSNSINLPRGKFLLHDVSQSKTIQA